MIKLSFPLIFVYLFILAAPFLLWPIELFFPFPYIVEEIFKLLIVFLILGVINNKKQQLMAVALGGFLFAFSESMFYIINVFLVGNANLFIIRLILTVPMHMITTIIILAFAQIDRRLTPVGLIFAILMHYMFNLQTF